MNVKEKNEMKEINSYNVSNNLSKLENMSEYGFKTKSMELCKTIIMDQKMIEDIYVTKKNNFEELNKKMLKEMENNHDNSKSMDKLYFQTFDSYFELVRQEARREYSKRLLKIILG